MNASMQSGPVRDLSVSVAIALECERIASRENRSVNDVLASAIRAYEIQQIERHLDLLRPASVEGEPIITDEEIEAFVDETRSAAYQARGR